MPPAPITPEEENAMFMQGDNSQPKPGEDHEHHLEVHTRFESTPMFEYMPKAYQDLLYEHKLHTAQMLYMEQEQKNALAGQMPAEQGEMM